MNKVGFVYHPIYLEHDTGSQHPERKSRLEAILRQLKKDEIDDQLINIEAQPVDLDWVYTIHDPDYIELVKSASEREIGFLQTQDCPVSKKTYESALIACGGVLASVDKVMDCSVDRAFCAVRPPGHHAERDVPMGFCFINNVAVAARYLQKKHNLERILILDWDVHHGNGTQHSFERDESVFYCSIHEDPTYCYPGTGYAVEIGLGNGKGTTLNCPMPIGSSDDLYYKAFETEIIPAVEKFKPDFIIISAGFDAHEDDPLAQINLTDEAFVKMTHYLNDLSNRFCDGKMISVLEGGYNLLALGRSVSGHIKAMME